MGKLPNKPGRSQAQGAEPWPEDGALVALAAEHRSMGRVAAACGKSRGSLRDYLAIRPALSVTVHVFCDRRGSEGCAPANKGNGRPPPLATRRVRYLDILAKAEAKRAANRRWARNQAPESRRKWNQYNRARRRGCPYTPAGLEYVEVIRHDPCVYCGAVAETIDHIDSVSSGGDGDWLNIAPACVSCNSSKGGKSLLEFLYAR